MFCLLTGKDILPFPFSIAPLLVLWLPLFTRLLFFVALHYPRFVYFGSYPRSHPQTLLSWGVRPIYFFFMICRLTFHFFLNACILLNCFYQLCLLLPLPILGCRYILLYITRLLIYFQLHILQSFHMGRKCPFCPPVILFSVTPSLSSPW